MSDIYRSLNQLDTGMMGLGDFLKSSKDAYESADKRIHVELNKLNNLFGIPSNHTANTSQGPIKEDGENPLENSLKHIGDLFRSIGQAITNIFKPKKDPKEVMDLADRFIQDNPYASIAYQVVEDVDIPPVTGDFDYANRPIIGHHKEPSEWDIHVSNVREDMWGKIWLHIKNVGDFVNSIIQDFKELAKKYQQIMAFLPGDIEALEREPWVSTMKNIADPEGQYQYAINQISKDKEAAHAMILGWMATNPSGRGIDTKYYPQLLAILLTYEGKGALTLQQLDDKYREIYNGNEAAIRKAEEKAKAEESSFLDKAMEWTHTALDILGWIPLCGDVCDLVNAGLYLIEGNFLDAALSCIAFVPAMGQFMKGILKKLFNAGDDAKAIAKILAKIDNPKAFISKLKNACTDMLTWIKNLPNAVGDMLDNPFIKKMLGGAKKGIDNIIDGIAATVKNATEWIQRKIDDVVNRLSPQLATPDGMPVKFNDVVDQGKKDIPDIPRTPVQENYNNVMNATIKNGDEVGAGIAKGTSNLISEADRVKLSKWTNAPSDELYLANKKVFDNDIYYDQATGKTKWPGQYGDVNTNGFVNGKYDDVVLTKGMEIDRYGGDNGTFFAEQGISINERAMAPNSDFSRYNIYEVNGDIPVRKGTIASWFDQPGGGIQYQIDPVFVESIKSKLNPGERFIEGLIRLRYLVRK
ncbi:glycohydrolase toxin TNT-related protein [Vallitalea pronyensis]|uniref:Glycohydrolase toxin TNT-related protein n=1 Tax=Vallitalea pronyensis TaxID=1348613 RepID=A0A8J8MPC6_9FIRM|nr:glycohydrolase toxin TNT-related protein [Vallitalea pronyensis]QUI25087.1 glycohydrolase toxin TNT-related protein [Vallitalea pronyensis]